MCLVNSLWLPLGRSQLLSDFVVLSRVDDKTNTLHPRTVSAEAFDRFVRGVPHLLPFVRSLTLCDDAPMYTLWRTGARLPGVRTLRIKDTYLDTAPRFCVYLDAFDALEHLRIENVRAGRFPGSYLAEREDVVDRKPSRPFSIRIIDWATEELCWWLYEHSGGSIRETTIFNDHRSRDMERTIEGLKHHIDTLEELTIRMTQVLPDLGPTMHFLKYCTALSVLKLPYIDVMTASPILQELMETQLPHVQHFHISLDNCRHDDLLFIRVDEGLSTWMGLRTVVLSLQPCTMCMAICTSAMPLLAARGILQLQYDPSAPVIEPPS
ncbi:hypothetical protein EXIGLDRAFT_727299 [Exidia glandulosa HHB12029]|uniref:F-box domain-containing protein n=1 Tax=Exidia glandulosa HHB12029 TaxID=1314781 RepID=A0A165DEQ3_EXIGL|nr:hypothetical protein EXIGLDRAFT_727299 [Exidia glandulosa HHB12029]